MSTFLEGDFYLYLKDGDVIMKDYSKGSNSNYLVDCIHIDNDHLQVTYANGERNVVPALAENIAIFERMLDKQADDALVLLGDYELSDIMLKYAIPLSFLACLTGGYLFCNHPNVYFALKNYSTLKVGLEVGAFSLIGTIPATLKFIGVHSYLKELQKIQYLKKFSNILSFAISDSSVLSDLDNTHFIECVRQDIDPFSLFYLDRFKKSDLEEIVNDISDKRR